MSHFLFCLSLLQFSLLFLGKLSLMADSKMRSLCLGLSIQCIVSLLSLLSSKAVAEDIQEIVILADQLFKDTTVVSPTSVITAEQLDNINLINVEDSLSHEPSLVVRKRFIGDANGVIGIRGSNMFQTTRSMVFADGMPLHYHLQTRYRGAPRWSLVSPGEIDRVEVIYGPYSSEYSGNAMGGVVNLLTRQPGSERIEVETGYFSQSYDALNADETFTGHRVFTSYENTYGALGLYASYTGLNNDGQPQTQFFAKPSSGKAMVEAVTGAVSGVNEYGEAGVYFADSGPEQATTDLYKLKLFYQLDSIQLRGSIAYEERNRQQNQNNNFLRDASGNAIFDRRVEIDGSVYDTYQYGRSRLQDRTQDRDSILVGVGASKEFSSGWIADSFFSVFEILQDIEIRSGNNPAAESFVADNERFRARITEYDNTGWQIVDIKLATDNLAGDHRQRLSLGLHHDKYELTYLVDDYNAIAGLRDSDETDGDATTGRADSGGTASTFALFTQYGYQLADKWDLSIGLRYEDWQTDKGFLGATQSPPRSKRGWSPKLSIAWSASDQIDVRYSVARALRFPVIEELYVNVVDGSGTSMISDPTLEPEDGLFHNLSIQSNNGFASKRLNVFHEVIEDVIFNQRASNGVSSFLPIGEVTTTGIEFTWEQQQLLNTPASIRYNLTYTDSEITDNIFNPTYVGNEFPRTAQWRSNMMLSYQWSESVHSSINMRYASNSYGALDNSDKVENVFGAQDDYFTVGIKANWQIGKSLKLSAAVDNLFNQQAYVYHPWPGRTFHIKVAYKLAR